MGADKNLITVLLPLWALRHLNLHFLCASNGLVVCFGEGWLEAAVILLLSLAGCWLPSSSCSSALFSFWLSLQCNNNKKKKDSQEEVSCAEELATFAGSLWLQHTEERHRHDMRRVKTLDILNIRLCYNRR